MSIINRSLMFVFRKEPLRAWIQTVDPQYDGTYDNSIAHLVPPIDDDDDEEKILRQVWEIVFENELEWWCGDKTRWPTPRTLDLFRQWFGIEFIDAVDDLCGWEIEPERFHSRSGGE